jgi:toxin YoeB
MRILFSEQAWEDYEYWVSTDRKILKRINLLIRDTCSDPFRGIGKPEPLRHVLKRYWSRRITDEHRMVYRVEKDTLMLAQLRYHYGK